MSNELDRERQSVAATPGGGETPAPMGIDSSRRGPEHGVREGASGDQPPARSTRPDRATRFIETAFGILSYSELAPILAERVLRVEARIYGRDFEDHNLDERLLSELHGLICADLVPEWAGRWRSIEVRVGNLEPPLPHKIPILMRDYGADLIARRHLREVPIAPYGTLSDYVPFYFTPYSIMLLNIKTGYGGTPRVSNAEIVILVSSLRRIAGLGLPFVFTNQHAYPVTAEFFNSLGDLGRVDWPLLQARDFRHDPEDPGKKERYQAEALIHQQVPLGALEGIVCSNREAETNLQRELEQRNLNLRLLMQPTWYFL